MLDEAGFKEVSKRIFDISKSNETEVMLASKDESLARFSNNIISQHISSMETDIIIRVLIGQRQGKASTTQYDQESLVKAVKKAEMAASAQREDPSILPLAPPHVYGPIDNYVEKTARISPDEKVSAIKEVIRKTEEKGLKSAGIFSNEDNIVGIANSNGLYAYNRSTSATFSITAMTDDSSGWAEDTKKDVYQIDHSRLGQIAIEKADSSRGPKDIDPGEYTVILEHAAVSDLLLFMAYEGFGALNYIEGRSFLSGKLGNKVFGETITIIDDPFHPMTIGMSFDFEGMPKRPIPLVVNGIAKNIAHDRKTACKAGTLSTGHALPQPNPYGPMPLNIVLKGGDSSIEEMIRSTNRGILVTRFHYTNIIDPVKLTITGMTRDATFLVVDGKIAHPVKNMRFTDSVVRIFNEAEALSKDQIFAKAFFGGGFVVPAMKIRGFNFSSTTRF